MRRICALVKITSGCAAWWCINPGLFAVSGGPGRVIQVAPTWPES
ncbi:hypothetical protein TcasGA2_TC032915 [Tribolium castaneum]|uniref:Uncharacterized protein n=1 Tax=Tribolium castaneum TaxID=7070 RepID=A0A139WJH3_TRICA|nr:hypothetical protein TcasGA2_TC032915 [Tribolium castaneum]